MKIEPTYVTFEQSKLLRQKGFNEETVAFWNNSEGRVWFNEYTSSSKNSDCVAYCYSAPEQWLAAEWLRVNHGVWIVVNIGIPYGKLGMYYSNVIKFGTKNHKSKFRSEFYNSPQEAYSAAFDYVLNNLI